MKSQLLFVNLQPSTVPSPCLLSSFRRRAQCGKGVESLLAKGLQLRSRMEEKKHGQEFGRLKIMLAVTNSPESKAALCWAVENLICKEDWVLLYHTVKTPQLIPTAMGMVPFSGASPAMQGAHIQVAMQDAVKLLAQLEAFCKNKKIFPKTEVDRCEHREEGIVEKVKSAGITHLVMGMKTRSKFSIKSWGKKQSLTERVCKEVDCHVTLVDKKKRSTFHSRVAPIERGAPLQGSLPVSSEGPEITEESHSVPFLSRKMHETTAAEGPIADSNERTPKLIGSLSLGSIIASDSGSPDSAASSLFSIDRSLSRENSEMDEIKHVLLDEGVQLSSGQSQLSPRKSQLSKQGGQSPRSRFGEFETNIKGQDFSEASDRTPSAQVFYMSPKAAKESLLVLDGHETEAEAEPELLPRQLSEIVELNQRRALESKSQPPKSRPFLFEEKLIDASGPATYADSADYVSRQRNSRVESVTEKLPPLLIDPMSQTSPLGSPLVSRPASANATTLHKDSPRYKGFKARRYSSSKSPLSSDSESPTRAKLQGESPRFKEQDDVIAQLWEQVEKLREINLLRDQEILAAATRAQQAEKEAQQRERAMREEKRLREAAELKATRLAIEVTSLKPPMHPGSQSPLGRSDGYKDWAAFSGERLWTISEW